ncbi:SDR family NAD(P)-dependent oxidoreductase [Dasania marina]|uniref:SDR family NAD(P)-dependent oxidoreductase n=1 Tax=Dasania marina TaxID=471499 RepID=UPI00037DC2F1|nr:SDR family NAD(P)-dependent oxidoreductase [Dasania marina]
MEIKPGQVAVITGAGSGIGKALAIACARRGLQVLVADIEQAAATTTAEEIQALGGNALAMCVDVSDAKQVNAMAEQCWQHFGACDLLCNNAGVSINKPLAECTSSDWHWVLSVNTMAIGYALNAFLPRMKEHGSGHIVNTASMAGLIPLSNFGVYVASKYAVVGLSEVLAQELAADNIGVSILCPGIVSTRIFESERNRSDKSISQLADDTDPMHTDFDQAYSRILTPDQVASMVLTAVANNLLYIPTHPEWAPLFQQRSDAIHSAFDTPLNNNNPTNI